MLKGKRTLGWITITLLMVGCGNNAGSSKDPITTEPQVGPTTFNIKDTWRVTSKTCNGTAVAAQPHEAYKIDDAHFVSVQKLSEDESSLCKIGYVYDRIINSAETTAVDGKKRYNETAVLKGFQAKKTCWKKEGGSPSGAPVSEEVVQFGPEELPFNLMATADSLSIHWQKAAECPSGFIRLSPDFANPRFAVYRR